MQALFLFHSLPRLHFTLGTSDRVSTGNGLQPLLEPLLIVIRAHLASSLNKALMLRRRLLFRCLCHVQITPRASLSHLL